MEVRQRDYAIYIRDFVMDPEYVKYLYENGLRKEAKRVEKIALREKMNLNKKSEEKLECAFEKKGEKDLMKKENEIESILVTSQESIIPTINSSTSSALQVTHISLSSGEVGEEKINFTFESAQEEFKLKGKEQEGVKNIFSQFGEETRNKRKEENMDIRIQIYLLNEHVGKEEFLSRNHICIFHHNRVCLPTNVYTMCRSSYSILKEGEITIPRAEPSEFHIIVFEPGGR